MQKSVSIALSFCIIGFLTGQCYMWWQYERQSPEKIQRAFPMQHIIAAQHVMISDEHFSCDGLQDHSVGSVLSSLLMSNNQEYKNRLTYDCQKNDDPHTSNSEPQICTISYHYCRPWQSSECGSRILKFGMKKDGAISTTSFTCLDVP